MHIVLLILKIVGIILLILLALVLLFLLLLVFVPFFYRGEGSYYDNKPYAKFRIRYLFPLLQVYISYTDEKPEGKVKVFGFTVYDFFAPQETEESKSVKEKSKRNADDAKDKGRKTEMNPSAEAELPPDPDVSSEPKLPAEPEPLAEMAEDEPEPKTFFEKIAYFVEVIKEKLLGILTKLKEIKEKGLQLKEKITHITQQIKFYYGVWQMDVTQAAFQKAKRALLRLWKSIRPKKGMVKLHLGTGDSGSTGQICGIFGMMYPFVGKYVMIEPDFEKQIYEGDFYFKGHITVFALLRVVWIVLFDKDIRVLRKILMNANKEDKHEQ